METLQIRTLIQSGMNAGNVVVLVVPAEHAQALFSTAPAGPPSIPDFTPDLDLDTYIEKYEPGISVSTVRQRCADGWFPDTTLPDGTTVPGAYLNRNRQWRITLAGVREAQRLDREANRVAPAAPHEVHEPNLLDAVITQGDSTEIAAEAAHLPSPGSESVGSGETAAQPRASRTSGGKAAGTRKKARSESAAPNALRGAGEQRAWRRIRGLPS